MKKIMMLTAMTVFAAVGTAHAVPTMPTTTGSTTYTVWGTGYNLEAAGSVYDVAGPQAAKVTVVEPAGAADTKAMVKPNDNNNGNVVNNGAAVTTTTVTTTP